MRPSRPLLLGAVLALGAASPAAAANVTVRGLDTLTWDNPNPVVMAGDTVTWTFPGTTQLHNVASTTPNWSYASPLQPGNPDGTWTFSAPGNYGFVCQVHSGMTGTVSVTDASGTPPPPPPPPPPSEQPFPNDSPLVDVAPTALERGGLDRTRPALRSVRVQRMKHGARIRFHVSERARVTVRFERAGKLVATRHVNAVGTESLSVRGKALGAGRYRVQLRAVDVAGNRSGVRTARLTMR